MQRKRSGGELSRNVLVDLIGEDVLGVRFPGRTWEMAHEVVETLRDDPPEGYRLLESQVKPRAPNKSGRRCNVRLTFLRIDDRIPPMTTGAAKAFFEPYMLDAQGVTQ
jgi:hypothetical protein